MTAGPRNIAIIGAGIMGLGVALNLRRAGHAVTLHDPRGFPARQNASAMAGGMLAPYSEIEHLPPAYRDAAASTIAFWKDLLGARKLKQNGSLLLAHKDDMHMIERFAAHLEDGMAERITDSRLRLLEPYLAGRFPDALYIKDEAYLDPEHTLMEICRAIDAVGGKFREEEKDITAAQNEFDHVIDCRGITAANEDKDLRAVKGEMLLVENREFEISRPLRLMHPRYPLYIVPRESGRFMIGATIIESEGSHVSLRSAMELLSAAYSLHPSFADASIIEIKSGLRPAYPDNLPRITVRDNVIRCNGLFRHGYLLAPVMAACVTDMIDGHENEYMSLFRNDDESHDQRKNKNLHHAA